MFKRISGWRKGGREKTSGGSTLVDAGSEADRKRRRSSEGDDVWGAAGAGLKGARDPQGNAAGREK